ncbi:MAG: hypothetical protein DHS20C02_06790 [Micavibrio sp.]|nr:MAG: hypothetical protein DHS20C02_06790 [Micavibrio sp.]
MRENRDEKVERHKDGQQLPQNICDKEIEKEIRGFQLKIFMEEYLVIVHCFERAGRSFALWRVNKS